MEKQEKKLWEKLLSSSYLYRGKIINVRQDRVLTPNGKKAAFREVGRASRCRAILVLDPQQRVLLVRQYRHATAGVYWRSPRGSSNRGRSRFAVPKESSPKRPVAGVPEIPISINTHLLPIDGKQEWRSPRIILTDVTGHPAPHETHAQRLPLQVTLGKLVAPGSSSVSLTPREPQPMIGFTTCIPPGGQGRNLYPVPGKDRCCPQFVCTDRCIHASAPDVVSQLLKEVRVPEDEMIRRNNQSHVAAGCEPPDLALKSGPSGVTTS